MGKETDASRVTQKQHDWQRNLRDPYNTSSHIPTWLLIQVTNLKKKLMGEISFSVTKIWQEKWRQLLVHTLIYRNRHLHYFILTNEHSYRHSLCCTHAHTSTLITHSIIFPSDHRCRSSQVFYNNQERISFWFKWHRVWFSLFICSQMRKK